MIRHKMTKIETKWYLLLFLRAFYKWTERRILFFPRTLETTFYPAAAFMRPKTVWPAMLFGKITRWQTTKSWACACPRIRTKATSGTRVRVRDPMLSRVKFQVSKSEDVLEIQLRESIFRCVGQIGTSFRIRDKLRKNDIYYSAVRIFWESKMANSDI